MATTLSLPRLQQASTVVDSNGTPSSAFHIWWDKFAKTLENNFNDLSGTVQALVDLNDDNTLTPAKKPVWIMLYSTITGEQSNIDSQATTYGITTEKTNYDAAITTLTNYLATLTTPVAWDNLTGNTTITGTTFRADFQDVLTKKQLLLDKMHDAAKALADAAQTQANTATTNAATAQTAANNAQTTANTASSDAATAQTTANTVKRDDSISTSWTSPGTILSATDAGSDATITIANHTRKYTDATSKSVTGGSITGLAYNTQYAVYYDQTSRNGGSVTYHATTDPNTGLANAAAGRHFCGKITTPAAGGGATSGGVNPPAGGGTYSDNNIP